MKTMTNRCNLIIAIMLFTGASAFSQAASTVDDAKSKSPELKTYLIEREIPGAGKLTPEQLKAISQKSCAVLNQMGSQIQWIHSYVTGDKIFCIYKAANEDLIREHAKKGGFPANNIIQVAEIISPETAK